MPHSKGCLATRQPARLNLRQSLTVAALIVLTHRPPAALLLTEASPEKLADQASAQLRDDKSRATRSTVPDRPMNHQSSPRPTHLNHPEPMQRGSEAPLR